MIITYKREACWGFRAMYVFLLFAMYCLKAGQMPLIILYKHYQNLFHDRWTSSNNNITMPYMFTTKKYKQLKKTKINVPYNGCTNNTALKKHEHFRPLHSLLSQLDCINICLTNKLNRVMVVSDIWKVSGSILMGVRNNINELYIHSL